MSKTVSKWRDLNGLSLGNFTLEVGTKDTETLRWTGFIRDTYKKNGRFFPYVAMVDKDSRKSVMESSKGVSMTKIVETLNSLGFSLEFKPSFDLYNFLRKNLEPTHDIDSNCIYFKIVGNRLQPVRCDKCLIVGAKYYKIISKITYESLFYILKNVKEEETEDVIETLKRLGWV